MRRESWWIWALLLIGCGADAGPSGPARLDAFEMSACSGDPDELSLTKRGDVDLVAAPVTDASASSAESCVSWSREGESALHLLLEDTTSYCNAALEPETSLADDGALDVVLRNTECVITRCSCKFDVTLSIVDVPLSRELVVRVHKQDCRGEAIVKPRTATLTLEDAQSGSACFER